MLPRADVLLLKLARQQPRLGVAKSRHLTLTVRVVPPFPSCAPAMLRPAVSAPIRPRLSSFGGCGFQNGSGIWSLVGDEERGRDRAERGGEVGLGEFPDLRPLHDRGDDRPLLLGAMLDPVHAFLQLADADADGGHHGKIVEITAHDRRQGIRQTAQPFERIEDGLFVGLLVFGAQVLLEVLVLGEVGDEERHDLPPVVGVFGDAGARRST